MSPGDPVVPCRSTTCGSSGCRTGASTGRSTTVSSWCTGTSRQTSPACSARCSPSASRSRGWSASSATTVMTTPRWRPTTRRRSTAARSPAAAPSRTTRGARAIDINPLENPYVRGGVVLPEAGAAYLDRSDVRPGMIVDSDVVVRAFAAIGFEWGGDWERLKDYQHFEAGDRGAVPGDEACPSYTPHPGRFPVRLCQRGGAVVQVQAHLVRHGFAVDVDGYFGPATEAAVRDFQADERPRRGRTRRTTHVAGALRRHRCAVGGRPRRPRSVLDDGAAVRRVVRRRRDAGRHVDRTTRCRAVQRLPELWRRVARDAVRRCSRAPPPRPTTRRRGNRRGDRRTGWDRRGHDRPPRRRFGRRRALRPAVRGRRRRSLRLASGSWMQRCRPERGHEDFSTDLCV